MGNEVSQSGEGNPNTPQNIQPANDLDHGAPNFPKETNEITLSNTNSQQAHSFLFEQKGYHMSPHDVQEGENRTKKKTKNFLERLPPKEIELVQINSNERLSISIQQILNYSTSRVSSIFTSFCMSACLDPLYIKSFKSYKAKNTTLYFRINKNLHPGSRKSVHERLSMPKRLLTGANLQFKADKEKCFKKNDVEGAIDHIFSKLDFAKEKLAAKKRELAKERAEFKALQKQYEELLQEIQLQGGI